MAAKDRRFCETDPDMLSVVKPDQPARPTPPHGHRDATLASLKFARRVRRVVALGRKEHDQ
ncbi:MAG TPA: hypothetical protein PKY77_05750 [Phycisphaerae bacterium]|nr:hypothetical protein [Phycisphaerae bacterium]HRY69052.1 hypothetical protein [Phycisphaerae bacterium]HSA25973.1 hypothetical protein [Phycisphaerae bacterium]